MAKHRLSPEALEFFRKQGSKGGKIGSKVRNERLSPERRSEIAKKAVAAREAKRAAKRKATGTGRPKAH
jgi:hypothetical protein